jgi:hypothetical protein
MAASTSLATSCFSKSTDHPIGYRSKTDWLGAGAEGGLANSPPNPSAAVGWVKIASRSAVYGMPPSFNTDGQYSPNGRRISFSSEALCALQAVKERCYRETEVAVRLMLQALIREPIQSRQTANACVRIVERYRASHVVRDDLLDPLRAKIVTDKEHAL